MGDDRNRILDLLSTGKITVEEATRLLDALGAGAAEGNTAGAAGASTGAADGSGGGGSTGNKPAWSKLFSGGGVKTTERTTTAGVAKFLMVKVLSTKGDNVNIKIPISLMRAGLKLTSLIPAQAQDQINKTMAEKGMSFDLSNFKPEDLEEMVEALREMEIDVDAANGDKVKVYAA
jgi:hypothetical protein